MPNLSIRVASFAQECEFRHNAEKNNEDDPLRRIVMHTCHALLFPEIAIHRCSLF